MIKDMTEGSPSKILWMFSLPMLMSAVFQQLYNVVDSVVAGQFIGVGALAAVGASYPVTMIFMAVATGANIGCSVVISQLFGAKAYGKMKTAVNTSVIAVLGVSAVLSAAGFAFCELLMRLMNTPQDIFADARLYLQIYIGGLIFLFLYNICTGIFTALGDSRTPLCFLIASSVGNIILDLVFVVFFNMGVAGVAWATFLCQGVAAISSLASLRKRLHSVAAEETAAPFSFAMLRRISAIAVPSILQQSFISVGNLLIQGLVNSYGSTVVAGYSAAVKLNTFAITSFTTLANGLSSFTAQNFGAGALNRVERGFRAGVVMAACVVLPFCAAFFFFGAQMIGLFMDIEANRNAASVGTQFLRIVSPFYIVVAVKLMADAVLRGAGRMAAFMTTAFTDLILRVVLAFAFSAALESSVGIWLSWPFGWSVATVLSCVFYFCGVWKKRCVVYTDPLALDEAAQAALSSPVCEMPLAEEDPIQ